MVTAGASGSGSDVAERLVVLARELANLYACEQSASHTLRAENALLLERITAKGSGIPQDPSVQPAAVLIPGRSTLVSLDADENIEESDAIGQPPPGASTFVPVEKHPAELADLVPVSGNSGELALVPKAIRAMSSIVDMPPVLPLGIARLALRSEWDADVSKDDLTYFRQSSHEGEEDSEADPEDGASYVQQPGIFHRIMVHPSSRQRLTWDLIGVLMLGWDSIVVPLDLSFAVPQNIFLLSMDWVTLLYWTWDSPYSCVTGYYNLGAVVMTPWKVFRRYAMTWCCLDILLIAAGWRTLTVRDQSGSVQQSASFLRGLRLLRFLRLIRLLKLKSLMEKISDFVSSEIVEVAISVLTLTAFIVWINHFIACGWFALGDREGGWVYKYDMYSHSSLLYNYVSSFHWSLTQFTPASMEIFPTNSAERSMAVVTLLFALIVFSSFLSSITMSMNKMRQIGGDMDRSKGFVRLRWYFQKNNIPLMLAMRIRKHLKHSVKLDNQSVDEKDVVLLKYLSEALRQELRFTVVSPILTVHPFLYMYAQRHRLAAHKLCTHAVSKKQFSRGDVVFITGESANEVFFIVRGKLSYTVVDQTKPVRTRVGRGEWVCEVALWSPTWHHTGELEALMHTELLVLDAKKFASITATFKPVLASSRMYATMFMEEVNATPSWTDLGLDIDCGTPPDLDELTAISFPTNLRNGGVANSAY